MVENAYAVRPPRALAHGARCVEDVDELAVAGPGSAQPGADAVSGQEQPGEHEQRHAGREGEDGPAAGVDLA